MIKCLLCGQEFKSIITNSHLKKHGITTIEYKSKFGKDSLSSDEYKKSKSEKYSGEKNPMYGKKHSIDTVSKISKNKIGTPAWNKGINLTKKQKENLSKKALERNIIWREKNNNPNLGRKLSEKTKNLIREKRKVQQNSIENSEEIRIKHRQALLKSADQKKKIYFDELKNKFNVWGFTFLDTEYDSEIYKIQCTKCNTIQTRSRRSKHYEEMCLICNPISTVSSKGEVELKNWLESLNLDVEILFNTKNIIPPYEIDIAIPDLKICIEFDGLYWHSELAGKTRNYHITKTILCNKKEYNLIHIFEDEWENKKDLVKFKLLNILKKNENYIHARKCVVKEISPATARTFVDKWHLQGYFNCKINLGLFYDDELVYVMTFSKLNISKGHKSSYQKYELSRMCGTNLRVNGAASKLFSYFIKTYNPIEIITFADRRWSSGNTYQNLNMKPNGYSQPNYWYIKGLKRIHRFNLRKNKKDIQELSEWENRKKEGWNRIWDCGNYKFIWK